MPISVMIKPSSSLCNLKCQYCFYSSLASERAEYSKGFMREETAERIIKSALDYADGTQVFFTFQGGEPLLSDISFYEFFVQTVKELNKKGSLITYCLQTNGTLINEKWCKFFQENNFLIGLSLDGNREQNAYRTYADGRESFDDVMKAASLLKEFGVLFNVLSVVTKRLANSVRANYRFMKQNGIYDIQYINCLKPFEGEYNADMYMNDADYALFLEKAFKLYFNDNMKGVRVSVRSFDNYLRLLSGRNAEQCGMNGFCSSQFVVEGDGTVYPCDFYCTDAYALGNINTESFIEIKNSDKYKSFLSESFHIADECRACSFFAVCRGGGCKRSLADENYCGAYKQFFSYSIDKMKQMIRQCL